MNNIILDSLEIRNYRGFQHLVIEKLGRVNLIVGKNNSGKSSLLEAVAIYMRQTDRNLLREIAQTRDEDFLDWMSFHHRHADSEAEISIGPVNGHGFHPIVDNLHERPARTTFPLSRHTAVWAGGPLISVPSAGLLNTQIIEFWDKIAISTEEDRVIEALKIIDPRVERVNIAVKNDLNGQQARIPKVRLRGQKQPVSLRTLGEAMVRLFGLALAMVNVSNGAFLVDEIENGLHYSVQPDVWKLVFHLASQLNIQVFATTHSGDCIRAFQMAAANHVEENILIRLGSRKGEANAAIFDEEELAIIARDAIEVR